MTNIVIYTKDFCPYCTRAKDLLKRKGVDVSTIKDIDITNSEDLQVECLEKSGGRRTVPQIFINDTHVGGYDDLDALNSQGGLDKLLQG